MALDSLHNYFGITVKSRKIKKSKYFHFLSRYFTFAIVYTSFQIVNFPIFYPLRQNSYKKTGKIRIYFSQCILNVSFGARAAYQLRNGSNFNYRITYEQPAKEWSYLMQSVVYRLLSNLLLLLSILLRMHSSKKFLVSRNFQIYHTIIKCTTLFSILLRSTLEPAYKRPPYSGSVDGVIGCGA